MDRIFENNAGKRAVLVTIRHLDAWDDDRHGAAFLGPLVAGIRRRLAVAAPEKPAAPGK